MTKTAHWLTDDYLRIVSAHYDADDQKIIVTFGDGDTASITITQLAQHEPLGLDWEHMTVEDNFYIHIPALANADRGAADIPGFDVRALSDMEFAAHLVRSAQESARRIGERVRTLREAHGLSVGKVAAQARIEPQTLTQIESGQHDINFATLEKIAAAMGCTLKDVLPQQQAAIAE